MTMGKSETMLFRPAERFHLDAGSPVPLYHQLERALLDRIALPDAVGAMLPAEKDLETIFGVSRATVRKAYDNLAARRLIERRRAAGTRVVSRVISEDLGRLKSFTEEMQAANLAVSTEVLAVGTHVPDAKTAGRLMLARGEKTLCIRRLRGTSEFFPIVLLQSEIPVSFGVQAAEDFSGSLYRLIEENHRLPILWAQEEIRAAQASADEAKHLKIAPASTVLVMERLTYTRGDQPIEFVRAVYQPEHYTFSVRLRR
jgi:GntR family transcriptional regulator